jgi:hypothetical protein
MPAQPDALVASVRREMLERGFSLVDMPPLLDGGRFPELKKKKMVMTCDCMRWWQFPQLAVHACWLESLVSEALPEESVSLVALDYRYEQASFEDRTVDRLHADGSYVRSVYTLYGASTLYREEDNEHSVPRGRALLLTAMSRARALGLHCTLHRRPGPGPERAVIVCSFEPRYEKRGKAEIHREVARHTADIAPFDR